MKKYSYIILIVTCIIVSIMFFLPHKEKRTFDDVDTDYTKRFKVLEFGLYEQDNDESNDYEPIQWLVIDEKDDDILVISKDTIICIAYNDRSDIVTWDKSILRLYLNNIFYDMFLNDEERKMIVQVKHKNNTVNEFGHHNGADTFDRIFILSTDEYQEYFKSDAERVSAGTKYANSLGLHISHNLPYDEVPIENGTFYWARNVGYHDSDIACVNWDGKVNMYGYDCKSDGMGVRPCMWLKKEAMKWQKK